MSLRSVTRLGAVAAAGMVLAGCGGSEPEPAAEEESPAPEESEFDDKAPEEAPDPGNSGTDESGTADWSTTATEYRDQVGETFTYECPGGADLADAGTVWGDETYTDDSAVCAAAVHAGLITPEDGGSVVIEIAPGEDSYDASERNGVATSDWGEWGGSFVFPEQEGQVVG